MSNTAATFCTVFACEELAQELAPKLRCEETDALAALLRAHDQTAAALFWEKFHETGHDSGDRPHPLV